MPIHFSSLVCLFLIFADPRFAATCADAERSLVRSLMHQASRRSFRTRRDSSGPRPSLSARPSANRDPTSNGLFNNNLRHLFKNAIITPPLAPLFNSIVTPQLTPLINAIEHYKHDTHVFRCVVSDAFMMCSSSHMKKNAEIIHSLNLTRSLIWLRGRYAYEIICS